MADQLEQKPEENPEVPEEKDPFDMSADEFAEVIEKGEIELTAEPTEPTEPEGVVEQPTEPTPETFTIVHDGVEQNLDKDTIIKLAQKGFDYDTKVGRHKKMVELIDRDAEAQAILNQHFAQKFGLVAPPPPVQPAPPVTPEPPTRPKLKPLTEFESEADWLQDSVGKILEAQEQTRQAQQPTQPQQPQQPTQPVNPRAQAMQQLNQLVHNHDPEYAQFIIPMIDSYANNMTVPEYREASSSIPGFLAFYDKVKAQVLADPNNRPAPTPATPTDNAPGGPQGGKRFNLKPAGGAPKNPSGRKVVNIWDLSNDQFSAMVNRKIEKG